MSAFPSLKLKQFAQIQDRETAEGKYWKQYYAANEESLLGTPSTIHFNPATDDTFVVTASTKVHLFDVLTNKILRSYSRFQDEAYCGLFRKDAKLLLAGDKTGCVKVFDVQTKALLRQLRRHSAAVHAVAWSSTGLNIISGSDDKSVKYWDLGTQQMLHDYSNAHDDYIRSVVSFQDLFITGSYDHSVKLWDPRQAHSVKTFQHSAPIERMLHSSSLLYAAAGNSINVYDVVADKQITSLCHHQKNITDIHIDTIHNRLLSCSLDSHIKIYNLQSMEVVHGIKVGSPLVSVAMSNNAKKLVIGCADGTLIIKTHKQESAASTPSSNRRHYKGAGSAVEVETVVENERLVRLRPYEMQLKKFNYQGALDASLKSRNPVIVITVLEELARRGGLTIALSGRDETTLEQLLSFIARYITMPRYMDLLIQVSHRLLDLYQSILGQSNAIDELFLKLQRQVHSEMKFHRQAMQVLGSLDCIINAAGIAHSNENSEEVGN